MEVRPGYKQTEVGAIPADWQVREIRSVCKLINGRGFKPFEWKAAGLPIIRIQNLNGSDEFNYFDGNYDRKLEVNPGQLLFAWSGSRGTSFGPHLWSGPLGLLNYHTWKMQVDESEVDPGFFFHALKKLTEFIEGRAHGASALVHTQKWEMEGFTFPAPAEQAEQRAIATALSDVDALLGGLDRLIAKKRDLKQAAMQQLLTGQTRLPGFHWEWNVVEFGEIASIRNATVVASSMPAGTQCVELEFIGQGSGRLLVSTEATGLSSKYSFKKGDVLFGRLRAYLRKYWLATFDGVCSTEIWPLIARNERLSGNFMHLLVQTNDFVNAAGVAYGTHMPRSDWSVLKKLLVRLPPIAEQTAIATVLSDMDAELEALEARRDKTRALKQAMMQELLTGRIRLV